MDIPIGIKTGNEGCAHERRRPSMLGDPGVQEFCIPCDVVVTFEDGKWVAQPTGISSVRTSRG